MWQSGNRRCGRGVEFHFILTAAAQCVDKKILLNCFQMGIIRMNKISLHNWWGITIVFRNHLTESPVNLCLVFCPLNAAHVTTRCWLETMSEISIPNYLVHINQAPVESENKICIVALLPTINQWKFNENVQTLSTQFNSLSQLTTWIAQK